MARTDVRGYELTRLRQGCARSGKIQDPHKAFVCRFLILRLMVICANNVLTVRCCSDPGLAATMAGDASGVSALCVILLASRVEILLCATQLLDTVISKLKPLTHGNVVEIGRSVGYSSGQRGQTVNLPANAFEGSNPSPTTTLKPQGNTTSDQCLRAIYALRPFSHCVSLLLPAVPGFSKTVLRARMEILR